MGTKTCCFTGHRPQQLSCLSYENDTQCLQLKKHLLEVIEKQIAENDVTHFISGMALGVDTIAAEIVLALKKKHPHITLEAAIPCETQAEKWTLAQQERYEAILSRCDTKTILQKEYTATCMQERNRYMVDHSDVVIAVWKGVKSGTANTVLYADEKGKDLIIIHPDFLDDLDIDKEKLSVITPEQKKVYLLRRSGMSFRQIGKTVGCGTRQAERHFFGVFFRFFQYDRKCKNAALKKELNELCGEDFIT